MTGDADAGALAARLDELERQNAALRRKVEGDLRPAGGWWRSALSSVVIVVAAVLVPVAIAGAWARVQLVDEQAFADTFVPLIEEPAVQDLIVDETMTAVRANVDFAALTDAVFDGVVVPNTGDRTAQLLGLLRQPAADGLEGLVTTTVTTAVQSEAFARLWETALRGAHRALTTTSTADGGGVVVLAPDGIGIALGPLVDDVKASLSERGIGLAALIPTIDRTISVGGGESVLAIRTGYALADTIGLWLPVIVLALFGLALALARRRSTAVMGIGAAVTIGAGSLAAGLGFGSLAVNAAASSVGISPAALAAVYGQLSGDLRDTAGALAAVGVITAVLGWFAGRSRAARRSRAFVSTVNSSARRSLGGAGLNTGGFGRWVGRHRDGVRSLIVGVAVAWLFLMLPLSVGDIALVVIVALVVAEILELLQRRREEFSDDWWAEREAAREALDEASA